MQIRPEWQGVDALQSQPSHPQVQAPVGLAAFVVVAVPIFDTGFVGVLTPIPN